VSIDEGRRRKRKLLKRTKAEEELKKTERERMLNIQLLDIRSSSHSSSFLECAKGRHIMKRYNLCKR
jgi:hypothetical protein